jgi:hypothetical protein
VAEAAGPRMQLTGIVGVLAIGSAIGPFAVADLRRISCIHRGSSGCPLACFASMAAGAIPGIGLAIVIAGIESCRTVGTLLWRPGATRLSRTGKPSSQTVKRRRCSGLW